MIPMRDLAIHRKMIAAILVASCVALLATAAAVLLYEIGSFRPRKTQEARTQAQLFSVNLQAPMLFGFPEEADEELSKLASNAEIEMACVYLEDLTEFATYRRAKEGNPRIDVSPGGALAIISEIADDSWQCPAIEPPQESQFDGERLDVLQEVTRDGNLIGFLLLRYHLPPLSGRLTQYSLMFGAVLFALLTVSILLSQGLDRIIIGPLLGLADAAHAVTDDEDYSVRVKPRGRDEIGYLTLAFNRMLSTIEQRDADLRQAHDEQRQLQDQLLQAQKMESIGRLAGGVAHDFNNLLTVVVGCTDLALRRLPPDHEVYSLLDNIRQATGQATGLTQRLLAFARRQVIAPRLLDINIMLMETEKMLRTLIGDDIELAAIARPDLWMVKADASQVMQVLVNLTVNGRDAMPRGGRLTIETHNVTLNADQARLEGSLDPGDYVLLTVTDTGTGIPEDVQPHLFEPFFTTKEQGKGTGLGLATCYGIVKQSGGVITFSTVPERGTQFRVYLPRASGEDVPTVERPAPVEAAGRETLLVVEDNALVRGTTVDLLRAQGYNVLEAASGTDALVLVETFDGEIHLLVTDVVMPEMGGHEVSERVRQLRPKMGVLFVSGYTSDEIVHRGALEGDIAFLQKPFTSDVLIRSVSEVLDACRRS